jgi:hypothetical protein
MLPSERERYNQQSVPNQHRLPDMNGREISIKPTLHPHRKQGSRQSCYDAFWKPSIQADLKREEWHATKKQIAGKIGLVISLKNFGSKKTTATIRGFKRIKKLAGDVRKRA